MNSVHAIFCGMHAFFVFERGGNAKPQGGREKRDPVRRKEETQDRQAARGDARLQGGREKRDPVRRQEETQVRKAEGRNASPQGGREKRDPVRRPCGFAIRRQKRFDRFKADLKSAAVGFSYLL